MFFRQTGARANNCFKFKDKLQPIFLRFHSFTIHDSVESAQSLEVSSEDVSSEFSLSVHCSLPLCGSSSIEVLKFIPFVGKLAICPERSPAVIGRRLGRTPALTKQRACMAASGGDAFTGLPAVKFQSKLHNISYHR